MADITNRVSQPKVPERPFMVSALWNVEMIKDIPIFPHSIEKRKSIILECNALLIISSLK